MPQELRSMPGRKIPQVYDLVGNVRPKTSKKIISKKSRAINNFKSKDLSCFQ